MNLCITNKCNRNCDYCFEGSFKDGPEQRMSLADVKRISEFVGLSQARGPTVSVLGGREQLVFIACMLLFSVGGAVFGMSEEVIPFILIFVPLARALGYDPLVGVAVPLIGAGVGFAGAMINPFTVGVAQGIVGLPLFSGLAFRLVLWTVMTAVTVLFLVRYAARIRARPERSLMHDLDRERPPLPAGRDEAPFTPRHAAVLLAALAALCLLAVGALRWSWGIRELAALFFGLRAETILKQ